MSSEEIQVYLITSPTHPACFGLQKVLLASTFVLKLFHHQLTSQPLPSIQETSMPCLMLAESGRGGPSMWLAAHVITTTTETHTGNGDDHYNTYILVPFFNKWWWFQDKTTTRVRNWLWKRDWQKHIFWKLWPKAFWLWFFVSNMF